MISALHHTLLYYNRFATRAMSVHIEDTEIAEKSKIIFEAILTQTHNYFIRQFINDLLERTTEKSFMGGFVFGAPGDYERLKRKLLSGFHPDHNKSDPHCASIFAHIEQLHRVLKGDDPRYRARRVKENLGTNFAGYLPFEKPVEPTCAVGQYTGGVESTISPVLLGKLVILRGLKTRGALNGMVAQVTGFDASKGRYYVTLPTSDQYLLRPENLRECQFDVHNSNIEPTTNDLSSQGQENAVRATTIATPLAPRVSQRKRKAPTRVTNQAKRSKVLTACIPILLPLKLTTQKNVPHLVRNFLVEESQKDVVPSWANGNSPASIKHLFDKATQDTNPSSNKWTRSTLSAWTYCKKKRTVGKRAIDLVHGWHTKSSTAIEKEWKEHRFIAWTWWEQPENDEKAKAAWLKVYEEAKTLGVDLEPGMTYLTFSAPSASE